MSIRTRRIGQSSLSIAAVAVILVVAFPHVTGTGWGAIRSELGTLSIGKLASLVAVWFGGLCAYTIVLTASLPRLSFRQALTLNMSGSAVSNLVPFGGALGMSANYAMARSWGFSRANYATFAALTMVWNVVTKLSLPLVAFGALVASGGIADRRLSLLATVACVLLALVVVSFVAALAHDTFAARMADVLQATADRALRLLRSGRQLRLSEGIAEFRRQTRDRLRAGWWRMAVGMAGYTALQVFLLWLIMNTLHSGLSLLSLFVGFAVERSLTLLVVTPGGVGIAQTGAAAALIAVGGDPTVVAAGVLLYSAFTFVIEIPVGAAVGLVWWHRQERAPGGWRRHRVPAARSHDEGPVPVEPVC